MLSTFQRDYDDPRYVLASQHPDLVRHDSGSAQGLDQVGQQQQQQQQREDVDRRDRNRQRRTQCWGERLRAISDTLFNFCEV